ncbi:MAG: extracellular solute-binding protein [Chloroflexi bacterium]|nr:MAG: extracellular solute-binding protein [Chloroflexota bacterium]
MSSRLSRRDFLKRTSVIGVGVILASCGGGGAQPAAPAAKEGEAPKEAAPAAAAVVLQQWYHEYGEKGTQEAVFRIADEYNNMQDKVKVEVTWNPGDYRSKLYSALAAGTGPDCYEDQVTIDKVANKQVVSLDDLYEGVEDDFNPTDLDAVTIKGTKYGIRMIVDFGLLCTRNSMLEEAGLKHPETWDEMVENAKALTTGRRKGLFLGNDGGIHSMWQPITYTAGVNFLTEEDPEMTLKFNQPETVLAWDKLRAINNDMDVLLLGAPTDWWDPAAFIQGQTAMQWIGFWEVPGLLDGVGEDFTISALPPMNGVDNPRPATWRRGWVALVNDGEHVPEAKAYTKWQWIENTDWQNEWNTGYGFHVPPRKSAGESNAKLSKMPAQAGVDAVNKYGLNYGVLWTSGMQTAIEDSLTEIIKNGGDVAAGVQAAYDKCNEQLAENVAEFNKL